MALWAPNVVERQADQKVEKRGPAVKAAFDGDGKPTPAAQGFARSCGVEVSELQRLVTDKGEWLSYTIDEPGKALADSVQEIIEAAIKKLPIPKRMRWGNSDAEFVRPVKWLTVLHGSDLIECTILDVNSGKTTRGHRFHSSGDILIDHADNYEAPAVCGRLPMELTLSDDYLVHSVTLLNLVNDIQPFDYFTETGMIAIQVRSVVSAVANKELRSASIFTCMSH